MPETAELGRPSPVLTVRGLERRYPGFRLGPVDLTLGKGETLMVLGPNGSGKSTLLRLLAGLEPADRGEVRLAGRDLSQVPPHRRGIGMVFQDLALFPTKSVWDNLTYGPLVQGWTPRTVEARGEELLRQFRLEKLADRRPPELSGGERQRVALARALAPRPSLLLLDEPLSSADPRNAGELRSEIQTFLREADIPAIYVTHDLDEGFFLGHRIALIQDGAWVQEGPSDQVFDHPANAFAAWFLGYNVLPDPGAEGGHGVIAVLPNRISLAPPTSPGVLPGVVESSGRSGALLRLYVRPSTRAVGEGAPRVEVVVPREAQAELPGVGEKVGLLLEGAIHLPGDLPPGGFMKGPSSGKGR